MAGDDKEKEASAPENEGQGEKQQLPISTLGGNFVRTDEDYEALFMKDAKQRAHDAELEALAMLALFRSDSRERNQLMFSLEREQSLSPRMVDRHLSRDDKDK